MKDNRLEKNKQAFYSQLENMFAGKELKKFKGKSGFSNLLSIKAKYFEHIKQTLENKISKTFKSSNTQNELYEKAITFFDSYLNETGCPYFNKTEFYKNLYEKVYTNTSDTALFYKTNKLYYVKSDSIPSDAQFDIKNENEEILRAKIKFDCERLVYTSTNEKKELRFILKDLNKKDKTITLLVVYKDQKIDLGDDYSFELNSKKDEDSFELTSNNKQNLDKFHELLINYELDIKSSEVAESIAIYKKQKEIDFFIHKDAKSFLEEQFNIYLYNFLFKDSEIKFNEWGIERLEQIKTIKTIIFEIIEFISKFEDELRAMWLKPKFVKNLNYIISLNKIDTKFHNLIKSNQDLIDEWKEMEFDIANEFLPVDTKYLDEELKYEILSSIDNLDNLTDGVLIKSDNFQALNTILPKYKEQIDLIYIDPPFNTGSDFAYKDRFQDSTWLTLMENRLTLSKNLLSEEGSFYLHLDHNADYMGRQLLNNIYGEENFQREIIWNKGNVSGGKAGANNWILSHDLILYYVKDNNKKLFNKQYLMYSDEYIEERFIHSDDNGERYRLQGNDRKQYLKDSKGMAVSSVWDIKDVNVMAIERENFQTQKPEKLLERLIEASSNKNSFVMDFFSGSGTTINTAHKLGRKWIGVEMGNHFETINILRIKKTLAAIMSKLSKELEKDNKLTKGGIVKYYELESYEEVLSKAHYELSDNGVINLYKSEKLAFENVVEKDNDKVKLNYKLINENIDIFETISNITGFRIKKKDINTCVFLDKDKEILIDKNNLNFSDYPFLRQLIWWK